MLDDTSKQVLVQLRARKLYDKGDSNDRLSREVNIIISSCRSRLLSYTYVSEHQNGTLSSSQFSKYCTKAGSNQKCITELPLVGSLGKWLYSASISNSLSEIFLNKSLPFLQHPVGGPSAFFNFVFRGYLNILTPVRFAFQCIRLLYNCPSCALRLRLLLFLPQK